VSVIFARGEVMGSPVGVGNAEVRLSDRMLGAVIKAWEKGKEALTFLVIGTITVLLAFFLALFGRDVLAIGFLVIGCLIIGVVAYKFYSNAIAPTIDASKHMEKNAELINAVQDAALELTRASGLAPPLA